VGDIACARKPGGEWLLCIGPSAALTRGQNPVPEPYRAAFAILVGWRRATPRCITHTYLLATGMASSNPWAPRGVAADHTPYNQGARPCSRALRSGPCGAFWRAATYPSMCRREGSLVATEEAPSNPPGSTPCDCGPDPRQARWQDLILRPRERALRALSARGERTLNASQAG
jgi:hypothetical protein